MTANLEGTSLMQGPVLNAFKTHCIEIKCDSPIFKTRVF